jgi:hypothetical protein
MPFVQVAKDKKAFVLDPSGKVFTPWGFNFDRKVGVTTIAFLPKGQQLLRSGVWFQYVDFYGN